jgi:hypothetical protein
VTGRRRVALKGHGPSAAARSRRRRVRPVAWELGLRLEVLDKGHGRRGRSPEGELLVTGRDELTSMGSPGVDADELEELGWGALWSWEVFGREA